MFDELKAFRDTRPADSRMALVSVANAVTTPDASQPPYAWDLLAEGASRSMTLEPPRSK